MSLQPDSISVLDAAMSGESMTNEDRIDTRFVLRFYERLLRKLLEDLEEAYHRTPLHISSRPYIERARNLAQAGLDATLYFEEIFVRGRRQAPNS